MRMTRLDWYLLPILIGVLGAIVYLAFMTVGFLGLGVIGLIIGVAALRIELEQDGTTGMVRTTDLYARQIETLDRATRAEKAAHRAEKAALLKPLFVAKVVSAGFIILGFGLFVVVQLP
jgi:hypothetical protein